MTDAHGQVPPSRGRGPETAPQGTHFFVGVRGATQDIIIGPGERVFRWNPGPHDASLADLAGWRGLIRASSPDQPWELNLPLDTISAASVFSSKEAYAGERVSVIHAMAEYTSAVITAFGAVDTGLSLDTIGVTRSGGIFFVPPHNLSDTPEHIVAWSLRLVSDLEAILGGDQEESAYLRGVFFGTAGLKYPHHGNCCYTSS